MLLQSKHAPVFNTNLKISNWINNRPYQFLQLINSHKNLSAENESHGSPNRPPSIIWSHLLLKQLHPLPNPNASFPCLQIYLLVWMLLKRSILCIFQVQRDISCGSSRCGPWQIDAMDIAGREPLSAGWAPLLDPDGVSDALLAKDVATRSRRLLLHCIHANIASQFHLLSIW